MTITTWSGPDEGAAEDARAAGAVAAAAVAASEAEPGPAAGEPGEHATAAAVQAVRNTAATTRCVTEPPLRLEHPFDPTLGLLG